MVVVVQVPQRCLLENFPVMPYKSIAYCFNTSKYIQTFQKAVCFAK